MPFRQLWQRRFPKSLAVFAQVKRPSVWDVDARSCHKTGGIPRHVKPKSHRSSSRILPAGGPLPPSKADMANGPLITPWGSPAIAREVPLTDLCLRFAKHVRVCFLRLLCPAWLKGRPKGKGAFFVALLSQDPQGAKAEREREREKGKVPCFGRF